MKLLRYGAQGAEKPGLLDTEGNIRDLSGHITDISGTVLDDTELNKLRKLDANSLPLVEGNPRIGACVGNVGKFICIGLNYSDHAAETGAKVPEEKPDLIIQKSARARNFFSSQHKTLT